MDPERAARVVRDAIAHVQEHEVVSATDLEAVKICRFGIPRADDIFKGHCFEGRMLVGRLVGRCSRCGVGVITDS